MNLNDFVKSISTRFMELYNEKAFEGEYDPLLTNGYCLYLASLLKKILPEGKVYGIKSDHYFFFYDGEYYDGNGLIRRNKDLLWMPGYLVTTKQIREITDIEMEINMGEILDADFYRKEIIWQNMEPFLLQYGKELLEKTRNIPSR